MWLAQAELIGPTPEITVSPDVTGGLAIFGGIYLLFWLAVLVVMIIAMWKIFVKAGEAGWKSIVPIYNLVVFLKIVGRPAWWILLFLVPFVNFVISIIVAIDLGKAFGKDLVFSLVLLFLFSPIGYLILGFGGDAYKGAATSAPTQPDAAQPAA